MESRFRAEDGDRMDVDEVARSRSANGTPTLPPPHALRLPPLPAAVGPLPSNEPHASSERGGDYPPDRPLSAEHHERRRHLHDERYYPHGYHRSDPQQYFEERTSSRYPPDRPAATSDPYSHPAYYPDAYLHARPPRDPRDYSPRVQPARLQLEDYRRRHNIRYEYPTERELERREYIERSLPAFRDDHHFRPYSPHRHSEQHGGSADRHGDHRDQLHSQDGSGDAFTFAHRRPEHQRVRSFDESERLSTRTLPPAREILSGPGSPIDPTTGYPRPSSHDGRYSPPRSHSAGERLVRPGALLMEYGHPPQPGEPRQYAPEDILQSMRERRVPPPPHEYYRTRTPELAQGGRAQAPLEYGYHQSDRRPDAPQGPHRTGFPSSGLRSTAPATPPQPRVSHPDVSYRYPGPSLARIPRPPPRSTLQSRSQPTSSQNLLPRPRVSKRSNTEPGRPRSGAPSPTAPPPRDTAAKVRSKVRRIIEASVKQEEYPNLINREYPGPYEPPPTPPGPPIVPQPPQNIIDLQLPVLVSREDLPATSARRVLRGPPHRDPPPERTKEQDRVYAEWLFDMSTEVQRSLTRTLTFCPEDLLHAADELVFVTHWLVTYMHQLGLSYYSKLRHEMRVAFWWKINWTWFCVIQCSYDEAKKPIQPEEYEPWPDEEAIRLGSEEEMDVEIVDDVKKEDGAEPMDEISRYPPTVPENLRSFWDLAKRLNAKPKLPRLLGEDEWFEIGDVLVEIGTELFRFGLLDMDIGLLENEIMHRIIAVIEAWKERDATTLRMANEAFRKLSVDEQRVMIMAIKEDDRKVEAKRAEERK